MAIQDYKVSENYTGRDISSLSDRPNEDGLTAQQLKARFDQLNKEVIPNYNDLIDALDVILTNDSEDISALYALVEDHEGRLSIVEATLPNKSDIGHNHDERYYTESESDALLSGKSNVGHTHDDRYYTESEIDSKFSANSLADRARANHTGTQSADTLVDGTTNKAFLSTERTKLAGIESGAEVNQNAFSNIQVGATQIQADQKKDTFTLIAGANISLTPNATNDSITISATGDVSLSADNVLVEDVGEYYSGNNVEDVLQEVGLALQNISSDAEDVSITDAGDYFVSDNVEGALQEVGSDLLEKMKLDGSNSLVENLTFVGNGVLSYDGDRQILQYTNPDGTTNDVGAEVWFSEGKASGAIANGACVQFAGVQGDHYLFKTAVPSEINANPSLFMGIATSDIANNAWGKVTNFGVVHGVNTGSYPAGTILWFDSVNGGLTSTKPSYPNAQIQVCAVVVQNSTVGSIIVRPTIYQDAYTRSETDDLLDNKMTYLGDLDLITDLPLDAEVGDMYRVLENTTTYVWSGTEWIAVGGGAMTAENVTVADADEYWIGTNVEDVLSEIGSEILVGTDGVLTTPTPIDADLLEGHDASYFATASETYTESEVNTLLDGKLSLTGGTLTGALNGTTITTSGKIENNSLRLAGNQINQYSTDGLAEVAINYSGYQGGTTQFRNTAVFDGKNGAVATFTGSDKSLTLNGNLNTNGQIKFPATQNASADANTLDDYEEGTFTPTIVGSLTNGTGTYSAQLGKYTKIGNTVYFHIYITWSAHTGTGAMKAYGLPFTVTGNILTPIISYPSGITMSSGNVMQCLIDNTSQRIDLNQNPVGGSGNDTNLSIDTAGTLFLAGTYLTN